MNVSIVTGGCGFLGRHVVDRLLEEPDRRVVVLDDMSTPGTARLPMQIRRPERCQGVEVHRINLAESLDTALLARIGVGDHVDEVWHLASPASPPLYKARRVTTLRLGGRVLDQLLSYGWNTGARVLFASSSEVYGDPEHAVQSEDHPSRIHPTGPRSCYDAAKVYGEALCAAWHHECGVDARIARIFNTYGPGQSARDGRLVPALVGAALTGGPFTIHGSGGQTRTLGYVHDTVDGLFRIMRDGEPATPYNVGGNTEITVAGLVALVQSEIGPVQLRFGPDQDEHDPRRRRPDLERLRGLGWRPTVGLVEGLRETARWMRDLT